MKKILLSLLTMCILMGASAQTGKCGIDTRTLVAEEIAGGATHIGMLVKMAPGFDRGVFEKAGITFGAQAGQIVTMTVPVEALPLLESSKAVLQYSISHRIAQPECDRTRTDTRVDSVQAGLGVDRDTSFNGEGVYIGITDWGFDYLHPNYNNNGKKNFRLEMAWDHWRQAGPTPAALNYGSGLNYGSVLRTRDEFKAAKGDTANLYGYGTHGTHVAGICSGKGNSDEYVGMAPKARLLLCSFGLGEKEWMDAVGWMRQVAADSSRRLVVNSSWGMYSFSCLDGMSLLSQAINAWASEGTVFCTSAGNNGRTSIPFHVSRTFRADTVDTLRTLVMRASQIYSITETGQVLILWGEKGHDFSAGLRIRNGNQVWASPMYSTASMVGVNATADTVIYDSIQCDSVMVGYRIMIEHANPFDTLPHIQIDVDKTLMETQLFITATDGTVHAWNVANKENHAGNEGCSFYSNDRDGFTDGDSYYGIGEPACAAMCISVAAHNADRKRADGSGFNTGRIADFSSYGPLINGVQKPEISAPGVDIVSSISSQTTGTYPATSSLTLGGQTYIWSEMSGTSMSSPAVTGIVALILQANPALTTAQVRDIIFTTARNDEKTGPLVERDSMSVRWGWGKIDALRAVNKALSLVSIDQVENLRIPLRLFPNPAATQVTVNTGCGERQELLVYTIDGRLVAHKPVNIETTLDISNWSRGVYILRVGSRTGKLVVK